MTDLVEITVQSMLTETGRWDLVASFLKLRREVFIERMDWPLYHADSMEFEQYDRVDTYYLIAHSAGQNVGGARLLRTDRLAGAGKVQYSYMIRDAHLGLLDGLPAEICRRDPPRSEKIWELTRLISNGSSGVTAQLMDATNQFLQKHSAKSCLFLGPPSFMRMAKGLAFNPEPLGKILGNRNGRFLAFQCPVKRANLAIAQ